MPNFPTNFPDFDAGNTDPSGEEGVTEVTVTRSRMSAVDGTQEQKAECANASIGLGADIAAFAFGASGETSVGISFGGSILDTRAFAQFQGAQLAGFGIHLGAGVTGEIQPGPVNLGVTSVNGAGILVATPVLNVQYDSYDDGGSVSGFHDKLPMGRLGAGGGYFAGFAAIKQSIVGAPTLREIANFGLRKLNLPESKPLTCTP